jgi:hypothetical protein
VTLSGVAYWKYFEVLLFIEKPSGIIIMFSAYVGYRICLQATSFLKFLFLVCMWWLLHNSGWNVFEVNRPACPSWKVLRIQVLKIISSLLCVFIVNCFNHMLHTIFKVVVPVSKNKCNFKNSTLFPGIPFRSYNDVFVPVLYFIL